MPYLIERGPEELRAYQWVAVDRVVKNAGMLLTLPPGMGKTVSTLTAIRQLIDIYEVRRVLIIAPLLVAEETWPAEIEAWSHTKGLTYEVLTGSADRRESRTKREADIHIINKEMVPWLVAFWGDDWPYDMLVVDESSCFRNPSKRNKPSKKKVLEYALDPENVPKPKPTVTRFGALCKVRRYFHRVVLLTGTPAPKGLTDLWSQLYLVDGGERLGGKYSDFTHRWFYSDSNRYEYYPRPGAFEQIMSRIADVTLSMREEDWLTLPERIDNMIRVKLPSKVLATYKKFERTMLLEEHDIEAVNNGVLTGKLCQLANGSVYDGEKVSHEFHDLKLKALDALVEESGGQPLLVAYSYEFDREKLRKQYPFAEVLGEQPDQVKRWNHGEIRMLLAHPQSAAYGLNLQHGGHVTVWYGLPWSLELYIQFNKRLHRSGQKQSVIIHHLLAEDTVDERVIAALQDKSATQEAVIAATLFSPDDLHAAA